MTTRVYCEHGAFRPELYKLQKNCRIQIVNFPYERRIKKKHQKARPSGAKISDLGHILVADAHWPVADFRGSEKLCQIRQVLGQRTRLDALHVDSAYKSGCDAFFSRDRNHILARAKELKKLLGIRFFHPDDEWEDFLRFIDCQCSR